MIVKVLIVDDLSFMRTAIRTLLEQGGFDVIAEAENGLEGERLYRDLRPDVVIMDITMPVLDGIGALGRIMRFDPRARVVMCSAMGQQRSIIRAIQLGARDFVVKPFRPERIVSAVRKASGGHG